MIDSGEQNSIQSRRDTLQALISLEEIKNGLNTKENELPAPRGHIVICKKCGSSEMYQYTKTKDRCEECGNIQDY